MQKTAYEVRISDWSSDVCSSDLRARARRHRAAEDRGVIERHVAIDRHARMFVDQHLFGISRQVEHLVDLSVADAQPRRQIGRASCRERVCQYGVDLGGIRIIKQNTTSTTTIYHIIIQYYYYIKVS